MQSGKSIALAISLGCKFQNPPYFFHRQKTIFPYMKGQPIATQKMHAYLTACRNPENIHRPVLIHGPSGVGKSHLSNEMEKELSNLGYEISRFDDSGIIRTVKDFNSQIKPLLEYATSRKVVIFLDECQNLIGNNAGGISKIVHAQMRGLIFPHGDIAQPKHWVQISVQAEEIISVNFQNVLLVFMTNEPDKLESVASVKLGEHPFRRRMFSIELEKYPEEMIPEIIGEMVEAMGLRINDCCRKTIGRYHRGTMEALSVVLSMYKTMFRGERLITKDRLLQAARLTNFLPRGLIKREGRLLHLLSQNSGKFAYSYIATQLNCDAKAVQSAISYLSSQRTNGEHTPFVYASGPNIHLTENGRIYLAAIQKEGFSVI